MSRFATLSYFNFGRMGASDTRYIRVIIPAEFMCVKLKLDKDFITDNVESVKLKINGAIRFYCFVAVNSDCVPCNLSSIAIFIVFPSADAVNRATLITFPSRLSVSSSA